MNVLPFFLLAAAFVDVETKVPDAAVGIAFEARLADVTPSSDLLVRRLEPDGDQWVTRLRTYHFRGAVSADGWCEAFIPFSDAYYMKWGDKRRNHAAIRWIRFEFPDAEGQARARRFRYVLREPLRDRRQAPCCLPPGEANGRIAVLDMGGGEGAHVLSLLNVSGFPARAVSGADLVDSNRFSRAHVDLLVVPTSPRFPFEAADPLRRFLKAGGALFAFGGYAFDDLGVGVRWPTSAEMDVDTPVPDMINTHYGKAGDTMRSRDDAIGLFDPVFSITNAALCRAAKGQFFIHEGCDFRLPAVTNGYLAADMHAIVGRANPAVGKTAARRMSVLEAVDRFGRRRGPVLSIAANYEGPYAGSLWAFTAHPRLFKQPDPAADRLFLDVVRRLLKRNFLAAVTPEYDAYDPGENVRLKVRRIGNEGDVRISVAGEVLDTEAFAAPRKSGLVPIVCELREGGQVVDRIESAIVVRGGLRNVPSLEMADNYLRIGGCRRFFGGINTMGRIFSSDRENPLVWADDFKRMTDYGMSIFRILHVSAYMREGTTDDACNPKHLDNRPETAARRMDALVTLANEAGVVPFIVFHDWMPVNCGADDLRRQRAWNAWWTSRYRMPDAAVLWDIQNEPQVSGSYSLDKIDWKDLAARDRDRKRAAVFARWMRENAAGAREGDAKALVTVGNDQDLTGAEKQLTTEGLSMMNLHSYSAPELFRGTLKLTDRRFEGKGLSVGEFGSAVSHDGRVYRGDTLATEPALEHFLKVVHYTFGLGGSFAAAWMWKDFPEAVFPWGLFHLDMTPKPLACAYRNMLLALGGAEIENRVPPVFLVLPDGFRLGGRTRVIHEGLRRSADALIALGVPFSVINEEALDRLPAEVSVLVWPMAVASKDEPFERMKSFASRGGRLYVSGDFRWSFDRTPDRLRQPEALGLPKERTEPFDPFLSDVQPRRVSANGLVWWHPSAPELRSEQDVLTSYVAFFAGPAKDVPRAVGKGFAKTWTWMELPLVNGGVARTGVNAAGAPGGAVYHERRDADGRLTALVCEGAHHGFAARGGVCAFVSEDGSPLAACASMLILPIGSTDVVLPADACCREVQVVERCGDEWRVLEREHPADGRSLHFPDDTRFDARRMIRK